MKTFWIAHDREGYVVCIGEPKFSKRIPRELISKSWVNKKLLMCASDFEDTTGIKIRQGEKIRVRLMRVK